MGTLRVEIEGVDEIVKRLRELTPKIRDKYLRPAMRSGAHVVLDAAKALAKGIIKKNMTVRAIKGDKTKVGSQVCFRASEELVHTTKAGQRYFIPTAVEYGHAAPYVTAGLIARNHGRRGHYGGFAPKSTPPHPSLRPGFDTSKDAAEKEIVTDLATSLRVLP